MLELTIGNRRFCFGFSFFLLIAVVCRLQNEQQFLLSVLAVLLHELSHILAILRENLSVKSINFTVFGVHIVRSEDQYASWEQLVRVYLTGPVLNLLLALLFLGGSRGGAGRYFGSVNLLLGLIHLLPAGNLDGANALREVMGHLLREQQGARVSRAVSLVILLAAVPAMWRLSGNISPTAWLLWGYLFTVTLRFN